MTKHEAMLLDEMLEELDERFSRAGCNDYSLPDTPENWQLVKEAEAETEKDNPDPEPYVRDGKVHTSDFIVLAHLRKKLREHFGVEKNERSE